MTTRKFTPTDNLKVVLLTKVEEAFIRTVCDNDLYKGNRNLCNVCKSLGYTKLDECIKRCKHGM